MKEYKVITWQMGFTKNNQKLEDVLNQYAREGWVLRDLSDNSARIVFEREKNR